jgi:hypothetical protein
MNYLLNKLQPLITYYNSTENILSYNTYNNNKNSQSWYVSNGVVINQLTGKPVFLETQSFTIYNSSKIFVKS